MNKQLYFIYLAKSYIYKDHLCVKHVLKSIKETSLGDTSKKLFFLIILDNIENMKKSTFYDIIYNVLYFMDHDTVIPGNHCEYLAIRLP